METDSSTKVEPAIPPPKYNGKGRRIQRREEEKEIKKGNETK
jgi:hypothetical protein